MPWYTVAVGPTPRVEGWLSNPGGSWCGAIWLQALVALVALVAERLDPHSITKNKDPKALSPEPSTAVFGKAQM